MVAKALGEIGDVELVEVSRQPEFRDASVPALIARHARQWRVERRWARHLGVSRRWFLSLGLLAVRMIQLLSSGTRRIRGRQNNIERALSAKHESVWRSAYEDRVDVLVVLEDDALLHANSASALREAVEYVMDQDLPNTFLDLAGGLAVKELRIRHVASPVGHSLVELSRPASNTTCAYLVGSSVLAGLAELTIRMPEVANLPSDWMINRYFIESPDQIRCFHAIPPAFLHGSRSGAVESSLRPHIAR
jgi:hypothetical protein